MSTMINPCSEIILPRQDELNITVPEFLIHVHFHQEFRFSLDRELWSRDPEFLSYIRENNLSVYNDIDTYILEVRLEEIVTELAIRFG